MLKVEAICKSIASKYYLLTFTWQSLLPVARKKVALFNPEERWVQRLCEFQADPPFRTDIHPLLLGVLVVDGSQLCPFLGITFGWRELPSSMLPSLLPGLVDARGTKAWPLTSIWGTISDRPCSSLDPSGVIWGLSVPQFMSWQNFYIHISISESVSRIWPNAIDSLLPQLHLLWPIQWMACFRHVSSLLVEGWRWVVLLLFQRDSI